MPVTSAISPAQSDLTAAVGTFLMDVTALPKGQIIVGQPNRVPEPSATTFVVMMPIRFDRIATNVDTFADSSFIASASTAALTVTENLIGTVPVGALLFGVNVPTGVFISSQTSGDPGGLGVYALSSALTLPQQDFAAGGKLIEMDSIVTIQLDFHSADNSAAQLAQTVTATLRDPYGVRFFKNLPAPQNSIAPLYADEPALRPFTNAEGNYEWRWVVDARFQINQVMRVPQQFADSLSIVTIAVPEQVQL